MQITAQDLEMVVLGIVHKRAPCTRYTIRQELAASPSAHFSSSPGSVYPIVKRLEARQWLASAPAPRGKQRRREYRLSAAGLRQLRQWLSPPLPSGAAGVAFDPIRTRVYFLASLPPSRRGEFIRHVLELAEVEIAALAADHARYDASGDEWSALAASGGLAELRAKTRWLRSLARSV